jgi:hypothetical protein
VSRWRKRKISKRSERRGEKKEERKWWQMKGEKSLFLRMEYLF